MQPTSVTYTITTSAMAARQRELDAELERLRSLPPCPECKRRTTEPCC